MASNVSILLYSSVIITLLHFSDAQPLRDPDGPIWKPILEARTQTLVQNNVVARQIGAQSVLNLQRKIVARGSCERPVCFAVDGSASIPPQDFDFQLDLISLLAALAALDDAAQFSAVQYGLSTVPISFETSNITLFLDRVRASAQTNASRTLIGAGIVSCLRRVRRGMSETVDGTIFVLGDGRANVAVEILDTILEEIDEEEVISVGIGARLRKELLLQIAGGVPENVILFDTYSNINTAGVSSLLSSICSFAPV
eukprot:TRINITY_DN79522_c0_g1_i1.p1 TRINITY_DN79522_c0_g1~~TRINITY_DN79522_c0_g1_i1.p1  ORF type:complete len:256 (-),score=30.44 TRINITY_DN79522_c0_g1_i1:372-1139(-)